jgi:hypothetical protein
VGTRRPGGCWPGLDSARAALAAISAEAARAALPMRVLLQNTHTRADCRCHVPAPMHQRPAGGRQTGSHAAPAGEAGTTPCCPKQTAAQSRGPQCHCPRAPTSPGLRCLGGRSPAPASLRTARHATPRAARTPGWRRAEPAAPPHPHQKALAAAQVQQRRVRRRRGRLRCIAAGFIGSPCRRAALEKAVDIAPWKH